MEEQRREKRRSLTERCEKSAEILSGATTPAVAWCHLNDEGDLLTRLIPHAVQITGSDTDDRKEEILEAFQLGQIPALVTKSKITGYGLNWQHAAWHTFFPSHSYQEFYQSIRRSYRFGQVNTVQCHMVTSEGVANVKTNLLRKQRNAEAMFEQLVAHMNNELNINQNHNREQREILPAWL